MTAPLSLVVTAFAPVADVRGTLTPQLRLDTGPTDLILVDLGGGHHRLGEFLGAHNFFGVIALHIGGVDVLLQCFSPCF